jgi:hypothetical protein
MSTPPDSPSWALRRVRAIRAGVPPEPLPEPAQPWDDHAGHFREYYEGVGFCNPCGVQLVKPVVQDEAAKLQAAQSALDVLTPRQLVALLARMRPDDSADPLDACEAACADD